MLIYRINYKINLNQMNFKYKFRKFKINKKIT